MSNLNIAKFLGEIRNLHYVVQRHWAELPDKFIEGHSDIDLFVSEKDREELSSVVKRYPEIPIDVRSPEDGYYPLDIGLALLTDRIIEKGLFWIPNSRTHFLSLYYHSLIHKDDNPYRLEVSEIFKKAYPPVRCKDSGVGYYP